MRCFARWILPAIYRCKWVLVTSKMLRVGLCKYMLDLPFILTIVHSAGNMHESKFPCDYGVYQSTPCFVFEYFLQNARM
jgi:hypothetical protein